MKGAISFDRLHVPIALRKATQDSDIQFQPAVAKKYDQMISSRALKLNWATLYSNDFEKAIINHA